MSPAGVDLKQGGCQKLYCRGGSSDRSSFFCVWVVDTKGVKTGLGFMGKSQLKESKRSQCEAQSVNQCGSNKSRLKIRFEFHISVINILKVKEEPLHSAKKRGLYFSNWIACQGEPLSKK